MKRKRKAIPLGEQLGAALACLLPQEIRDELRLRKAPWRQVRSLFEMHHIVLHAHDGSDRWHNLHPMLKEEHRERSKIDTSIAAKTRRLDDKWRSFMRAIAKGQKPKKRGKSKWQRRRKS